MSKAVIKNHIIYFFIVIFLAYNLFFATGYYSLFSGIYYQPNIIFTVFTTLTICILLYLTVPQKLKIISPILVGAFFSCYYGVRILTVFDFNKSLEFIHFFSIGFPVIIGAIVSCTAILVNKINKKAIV